MPGAQHPVALVELRHARRAGAAVEVRGAETVRRGSPGLPEERELAPVEGGLRAGRRKKAPVGDVDPEPTGDPGELPHVVVDRPAGALADEEEPRGRSASAG